MESGYISGRPPDLERTLRGVDPVGISNLSHQEIADSVVGYVRGEVNWPGTDMPVTRTLYCWFPMAPGSLEIPIAGNPGICVALDPDRYGSSSARLARMNPQRLPFDLAPHAEAEYSKVLARREAPIGWLLETAGYVVNSSMRYDFDRVIEERRAKGFDTSKYDALAEKALPSGDEVLVGICSDAGVLIRQVLLELHLEPRYVFSWVKSGGDGDTHDTTAVIDRQTGNWMVISSKSPTKHYNLVPADRLEELGWPYHIEK
jgi:hypothetical protein